MSKETSFTELKPIENTDTISQALKFLEQSSLRLQESVQNLETILEPICKKDSFVHSTVQETINNMNSDTMNRIIEAQNAIFRTQDIVNDICGKIQI